MHFCLQNVTNPTLLSAGRLKGDEAAHVLFSDWRQAEQGVPLCLRISQRVQGCTRGGLQGLQAEELRDNGAEDAKLRVLGREGWTWAGQCQLKTALVCSKD